MDLVSEVFRFKQQLVQSPVAFRPVVSCVRHHMSKDGVALVPTATSGQFVIQDFGRSSQPQLGRG